MPQAFGFERESDAGAIVLQLQPAILGHRFAVEDIPELQLRANVRNLHGGSL
jgi:hypothetical protein